MTRTVVVATSEDVAEGGRIVVEVDGAELGVFRLDGRLYAWANDCAHAGGPVCQGKLVRRVVERLDGDRRSLGDHFGDETHLVCPWHGYEFDVRTGRHPAGGGIALAGYPVREHGGEIHVDV
jgi:nitrite reductase/ring-hydroxylating ferredoxin subunit